MPDPESFDVIVIGAGVAAQSIVFRLAEAGRSVACVEAGPWGGTCATRGCTAKKPYVNAAQTVRAARRMQGKGVTGQVNLDWRALLEFKRQFTEPPKTQSPREMNDAGIRTFTGSARFVDAHTLAVGDTTLHGQQIVIAVGREPRPLDVPGAEHALTSDDFLELPQLPPRVLFVGGGYVAMEFAGVAAMAGAKVTVLEAQTYPLGPFDPDAVRTVLTSYHELGIDVLTQRRVVEIEKHPDGGFRVRCDDGQPPIAADLVINASGRRPALTTLGLDELGVPHGPQGVEVDEHLRVRGFDHLFAAGDCADNGRAPLTPTASEDGRVVAHNIEHGPTRTQARTHVASVAFTLPPVASVGLSEPQAREQYGRVQIVERDLADSHHYRQLGEAFGYAKLIFCPDNILRGAHLVGVDCVEVINLFALALDQECDQQTLNDATLAYPTLAFNLASKVRKKTCPPN